jgi:hypothetical protein
MKPDLLLKYDADFGILSLVLLGYFHPITALTQDLGRHLLTGNLILTTHSVPKVNLYAYTYPDFPFINHHWLSEVVFALIQRCCGFPGLFVLMLLLVTAAFAFQIKTVFLKVSSLALGLSGMLYLGILFERTDLRPELFSFFFLSVFVTVLYGYRKKATKLLYLLLPLQLLWVNMHIYFAVGLVVISLFVLDSLITHRRNLSARPVKELSAVFLLCCIASLFNPNGIAGLFYPLHVFQNYGYTIEENQTLFLLESLGFHKPSFPYFKIAVTLLFVSLGVNYKKTGPIDWLTSICFTILGFMAIRNFPLFVFGTFIPFTLSFTALLQKAGVVLPPFKGLRAYMLPLIGIILLGLFFRQATGIAGRQPVGYGVTPGAKKAVDFLINENIHGPLFNNFDIGSYLIYRLYPKERVFVDGRPEAYPADFFKATYIPMQENPELFTRVASSSGINTIFFAHTDQTPWGNTFLTALLQDPDWIPVYLDDTVIILLKHRTENVSLLTRWGMKRGSLRVSKTEESFEANLRLASFFTKVGWVEEGLPYYLALLKEKPDFCPALGLIANLYQQKLDPAAMIYAQRYNQTCL